MRKFELVQQIKSISTMKKQNPLNDLDDSFTREFPLEHAQKANRENNADINHDVNKKIEQEEQNELQGYEQQELYEQQCMGDLISQILNSRKPKVTDIYVEELQGSDNKENESGMKYNLTNLAFEIKNKDSNGRAILHKAAFDHKNDEMEQILREYTKRSGILDVNEVDWYGNTALILACINEPNDEVDKKKQLKVVEQLLEFNEKQVGEENVYDHFLETSHTLRTGKTHVKNKNFQKSTNHQMPLTTSVKIANKMKEEKNLKLQLERSVKVNLQNSQTHFTALHWACIHGLYDVVDILLQKGAKQFLPDLDGFYPIDYAGKFSHEKIVELMIESHIAELAKSKVAYKEIVNAPIGFGSTITEIIENNQHFKDGALIAKELAQKEVAAAEKVSIMKSRKEDFWKNYKLGNGRYGSDLGGHAPMMFSPIFNTRLLYWTVMCQLDDFIFCTILDNEEIEAYPEGPVMGIGPFYCRTPIHAASLLGNIQRLDDLLDDVRRRYQTIDEDLPFFSSENTNNPVNKSPTLKNAAMNKIANADVNSLEEDPRPILKKSNIYPFAEGDTQGWHLGMGKQTDVKTFIAIMREYQTNAISDWEYRWRSARDMSQNRKFTFDFQDSHLNTPLHLAAQKNQMESIQFLTGAECCYKMHEDIRNIDGHTPRDIMRKQNLLKDYDEENQANRKKRLPTDPQRLDTFKLKHTLALTLPDQMTAGKPYRYLKTLRDVTVRELHPQRKILPQIPKLVMKVDVRAEDPKKISIVNSMLQVLKFSKFQIRMVQSMELDIFYVILDLNREDLEREAIELKIKMKMFDINIKKSYHIDFKNDFDPFRSKDVQTVLWRKLQREINIPQYINQHVIQSIFPMHDMHELHQMRDKWFRASKRGGCRIFCLNFNLQLMPIPLIKSFFIEGSQYRYQELASIKDYFGEKVGFQYAWMSFYTVWLTLPTIVGISLTIFQMVKGVDTPLTTIYALFVCVWVTVFIERWKRKAAEISMKWGLSNLLFNQNENRIPRDEFHGYEAFDHDSHKIEKKKMTTYWTLFQLILQVPLYLILIALCIGSFILQEWIKTKGLTLKPQTDGIFVIIPPSTNDTFSNVTATTNVTLTNYTDLINTAPININNLTDNATAIIGQLANQTLRFLVSSGYSTNNTTSNTTKSNESDLSIFNDPATVDLLIGFVNTIFIEIFDFIYSYAATYYVNHENHKYSESYEKSYVFKMFIFKFINTNISIFYTAFISNSGDSNKFDNLYYMLLGMAATKSIKIFILKNLRKIASFWIMKKLYFRKARKESLKQLKSQQCYKEDKQVIHQGERQSHTIKMDTTIPSALTKNSQSTVITKGNNYQRSVFSSDSSLNQDRMLVDYIELNNIMIDSSELTYINERTDVFVLFGLATLYCCASPVVPLIAMIHNIIDMNMDLYVCYTTTKRPYEQSMANIGPWLAIAEFMAFAAVVSNCLLLYFSTNSLRTWLQNTAVGLGISSGQNDVYLLFLIVGVEHAIVLIKQLVAELVPDVPPWVEKAQQRVQRQEKEIRQHKIEIEEDKKGQIAKQAMTKIREMNERRMQTMAQIHFEFRKLRDNIKEKTESLDKLNAEKQKITVELRVAKSLSQKAVKEAEQMLQKKFGLSDFLQVNHNEWLAKERGLMLDSALNKNLQRRLYIQSYNQFERDIISRRIGKLFETKQSCTNIIHQLTGGLQIVCAQCQSSMAIVECLDCVDHYCKVCCDQIHSIELEICKDHRLVDLNILVGSEKPKVIHWKKFEYFNFPLVELNATYQQLQLIFNFFKNHYVKQNYVDADSQTVSLKSFFLDRNYHLVTDIQGQILQTQDDQMFGKPLSEEPKDKQIKEVVQSKDQFNDEELFYLNLIAHYLLQYESFKFEQFIKTIGQLQGGTFIKRIQLWFKIIQATQVSRDDLALMILPEDEKLQISRKLLEEVFRFSFVQLRPLSPSIVKETQPKDYKHIIEMIFAGEKEEVKDYQQISLKKFLEVVNNNEDINEFMSAVLQFRGVSNFVTPSNAAQADNKA